MKKNISVITLSVLVLLTTSLFAKSEYIPNLNDEISYNTKMLQEYKATIKKLEQRNKYLTNIKQKNPNLYVEKPLYEETKKAYIYRVKLAGAKAKNLNFKIEKHLASVEMYLKTERHNKNGYYSSTQNFYEQFSIPKDVEEEKITNKINGDYFEAIMPKK